jgi:hypothetical protein
MGQNTFSGKKWGKTHFPERNGAKHIFRKKIQLGKTHFPEKNTFRQNTFSGKNTIRQNTFSGKKYN